jgi:precorrin-2 dehydrogenase/sirohydrochlorin ferrochelatase
MLPIVLDAAHLRVGVAGNGAGLRRRLDLLAGAGVTPDKVFDGQPGAEAIAGLRVLFVAGLSEAQSRELVEAARRANVLVNVEDIPALCDFHVPAQVRRGDLLVTISTGGRAPGLSRALREDLERHYGPEWEDRLDEIAELRGRWRSEGAGPAQVSERMRVLLAERGWLA